VTTLPSLEMATSTIAGVDFAVGLRSWQTPVAGWNNRSVPSTSAVTITRPSRDIAIATTGSGWRSSAAATVTYRRLLDRGEPEHFDELGWNRPACPGQ